MESALEFSKFVPGLLRAPFLLGIEMISTPIILSHACASIVQFREARLWNAKIQISRHRKDARQNMIENGPRNSQPVPRTDFESKTI